MRPHAPLLVLLAALLAGAAGAILLQQLYRRHSVAGAWRRWRADRVSLLCEALEAVPIYIDEDVTPAALPGTQTLPRMVCAAVGRPAEHLPALALLLLLAGCFAQLPQESNYTVQRLQQGQLFVSLTTVGRLQADQVGPVLLRRAARECRSPTLLGEPSATFWGDPRQPEDQVQTTVSGTITCEATP